ncbi:hypothetical protein RXV95_08390 [Novosphingobium sp. ZN18A2]|uniref:thiosulfate dehydrogenase n=1 Tax=Novosphingobium sp. ZN18A2 TaxID=3079861 RepID=UPI0030CA90BD
MLESDRRSALAALATIAAAAPAAASAATMSAPVSGADFAKRLAAAPRKRDYTTCPMVLDNPGQWDSEALSLVIGHPGKAKQVWDNSDIHGAWLNLMRNSLNAQRFSFQHPDFFAVSATHGSAHLALFDQQMWDKYKLTDLAGDKFPTNTVLGKPMQIDATSHQDPAGPFSPAGNSISVLQQRGVVFLACHNAIWEIAHKLSVAGKGEHEAIAVDLTNHLIPGVVLTPGIVATIVELADAGFVYSK